MIFYLVPLPPHLNSTMFNVMKEDGSLLKRQNASQDFLRVYDLMDAVKTLEARELVGPGAKLIPAGRPKDRIWWDLNEETNQLERWGI